MPIPQWKNWPEWAKKEHPVIMPHPETGTYEEGTITIEDPRPHWKSKSFKAQGLIMMTGEVKGFWIPVWLTYSAGIVCVEHGRSHDEGLALVHGHNEAGWRRETEMYHDVFGVVPEHIQMGRNLIGRPVQRLASIA